MVPRLQVGVPLLLRILFRLSLVLPSARASKGWKCHR